MSFLGFLEYLTFEFRFLGELFDVYENQLRECRREKGVSQQDVANAIKVARRSIIRYENGVRTPTLATALRLSDYYKRLVNDIFHLEKIVENK